ncbi:GNAT family N-acetyltransferase [Kocuria massiliensis]|uniref:GNAT family N-acetyltransferase n=1 Tax=Kocuria massiliensis TaxID=1926282 RepID=UPI0022B96A97|nr:GNAT family protein [Kocuria massiliensis]
MTPPRQQTTIRIASPADAPELADILRMDRAALKPFEPTRHDSYFTHEEQSRLLHESLANYEAGTEAPFVIESGGEIIGRVQLNGITRGALQSCAIGYWIRSDRRRQGHATRAVSSALQAAFVDFTLHRVQAETLTWNVASQEVLLRNGFRRFGLAPNYLKIDGRWQDHVMYQALSHEPSSP